MTDDPATPAPSVHPDDPEGLFAAMTRAFENGGWEPGQHMPSHMPGCYGCCPDNAHGMGIRVHVGEEPDTVVCEHVFESRHRGAPGVAHGGAIAAVIDDLFGFVLMRVLAPAVTRDLAVKYRLPVRLDTPIQMRAGMTGRDGRELHMQATVTQNDRTVATATATFIEVALDHLAAPAARLGPP